MRIKKINESLVIAVELTEAPSLQMPSGVRYFTFSPQRAHVTVVNGAVDTVVLRYDHLMLRMFAASDRLMPNWVRDLVVEILADTDTTFELADVRDNEYLIGRRDESGEVAMTVAVVSPDEVCEFLETDRDKFQAKDFFVTRSKGGGTVAGDLWLLRNKATASA